MESNGHTPTDAAQTGSLRPIDHTASGTWIVVRDGVAKYIGRVVEINGKTVAKEGANKMEVLKADLLGLNPCVEFITPIRPVQGRDGQVTMSMEPMVKTVDFLLDPVTVYLRYPTGVYFYNDISDLDGVVYKSFVNSTLANAEMAVMHRRAEVSGLILPGGAPNGATLRSVR